MAQRYVPYHGCVRSGKIKQRNERMFEDYQGGLSIIEIREKYNLSENSVFNILENEKTERTAKREAELSKKFIGSASVHAAIRTLLIAGHDVQKCTQQEGAYWLDGRIESGANLVKLANKENPKFQGAVYA